jgi:hypothetical protein
VGSGVSKTCNVNEGNVTKRTQKTENLPMLIFEIHMGFHPCDMYICNAISGQKFGTHYADVHIV